MKKHTPGPWELTDDIPPNVYGNSGGGKECQPVVAMTDVNGCKSCESVWYGPEFHDEIEANARLIAAAPDLLEALDALSLVIGLTPIAGNKEAVQEAYNQARAAISKAIGD